MLFFIYLVKKNLTLKLALVWAKDWTSWTSRGPVIALSYPIQPFENPHCGCLVRGCQAHPGSWAPNGLFVVPGHSSGLPCHTFLCVPACYLLTAGHGRAEARSSLQFCPLLTLALALHWPVSSTGTNIMFLFCVHMCVWVGKKPNWRLEIMQSIETSRDSVGHLKKTWCTSLKPVNILLAGTPKM